MKKLLIVGAISILLVMITGCGFLQSINGVFQNVESNKIVVKKDDAKELDIRLGFGVGKLTVASGSSDWLSGELEYTSNFKVDVNYELDREMGSITVNQKNKGKWKTIFGEQKNTWDIQLSENIPMNLYINTGASDTELDLKDLNLSSLNVDAGVGSIVVDLSGEWETSFDATVKTGVGETTIILPKEVGVLITASTGIGDTTFNGFTSIGKNEYVNNAYDNADVIIHLNAETGIGKTTFILK
ncbi:toast rack family protein [Evansella sp. AB-P1]|uniref:toast rack family protein n=1 Tax=Evansella sp. AB-P1 TaxID=3037653 RepID=UPI00241E8A8A|nr:toast rack family protein [Evansella sp. AB-P1]MDG5787053.1 toast rack family protein [Evansella sp. AB-P1]